MQIQTTRKLVFEFQISKNFSPQPVAAWHYRSPDSAGRPPPRPGRSRGQRSPRTWKQNRFIIIKYIFATSWYGESSRICISVYRLIFESVYQNEYQLINLVAILTFLILWYQSYGFAGGFPALYWMITHLFWMKPIPATTTTTTTTTTTLNRKSLKHSNSNTTYFRQKKTFR